MARVLRIEFRGAVYHPPSLCFRLRLTTARHDGGTSVMARGNQGRAINRDDRDRVRLLETLGGA
jgi:hypothetical protein